ncbi:MAG TPA: PDZ domain-containing protein [Acidimicrobiia bacterium]|nr:PDZ domain-containing protein [Acidimicrobiia bacterium]
MNEQGPILEDDQSPDLKTKRKKFFTSTRVMKIICIFAILITIAVYSTTQIHVDKVIIKPGTAEIVSNAISVNNVTTYKSEGSFRFLTVYVSEKRPTVAEYLKAKYLGGYNAILPWEEVNGKFSVDQVAELNKAMMKASQNTASVVALNAIGCNVIEQGTGAIVALIQKKSAAENNLKLGDAIIEIEGKPIITGKDVVTVIGTHKPGDKVSLIIERGKKKTKKTLTITLGKRPDKKTTGFLGISAVTRDQEFNFPIDIAINPGAVSGPSAGLAFTLTIIDQLTKGDLTGGKVVAVTGEIALDGTVSKVGGVEQKAVAARRAGAKVMLVPKGELKEARKHSGPMKVFEVSNISQAIEVLEQSGGVPLEQMQSCPSS